MFFVWRLTSMIAVYLTSLTVPSHEEIFVIREPVQTRDLEGVRHTCVSDDDRAALVWNQVLDDSKQFSTNTSKSYSRENRQDWTGTWKTNDPLWETVGPMNCPMGRVFDSRLENCKEYTLATPYLEQGIPDSGIRVFDVHGENNITISLVGPSQSVQIFIGITDIEFHTHYNNYQSHDWTSKNVHIGDPALKFLQQDEWRTFTFEWDERSVAIRLSMSNTSDFYMKEKMANTMGQFRNLSIESSSSARIQFHNYTYLHTTNPGTQLITSDSFQENEDICIETLTSFCSKCSLTFYVKDKNENTSGIIDIRNDRQYADNETLPWRIVKLDKSLLRGNLVYPVKFIVYTVMNDTTMNDIGSRRWAILANYRKCPTKSVLNSLSLTTNDSVSVWCHEFSYSKNPSAVVESTALTGNGSVDPETYLLLLRSPFLKRGWNLRKNGTSICGRTGCFCVPGLYGSKCRSTNNPLKLEATLIGIGIVELRWENPWIRRSTNLSTFAQSEYNATVLIELVDSKLSDFPTKKFPQKVDISSGNRSFELPTATTYHFAVTIINSNKERLWSTVDYWVPASVGFASEDKELEVKETNTSFDIPIPKMLHLTSDSIVKIIVDGRTSCSNHSVSPDLRNLLINGRDSGKAWIVRSLEDPKNVPQIYSIPKKILNDEESPECHLISTETYYVIVAVVNSTDQVFASISSKPITLKTFKADNKQTLEWFYIVLILAICLPTTTFAMFRFYTSWKQIKSRTMDNDKATLITPISTPGDWQFDGCPHPVKLKQFEEYVKKAVADGELELQFRRLPTGLLLPRRIASLPENKNKNINQNLVAYVNPRHGISLTNVCTKLTSRYRAMMKLNSCQSAYPTSHPYETLYMLLSADDHTRVILTNRSCNSGSNYINANYISGYCKEKGYIATQAPMPETVVDFWTMIWQEEVLIVCMLQQITEDGQKTCEQYWPEIGNTVKHGDITILNVKQRVYADYCYRILQVTKYHETCSREIHHLQYTGWPEQEVPMYWHSIVEYFNELRGLSSGPGPIVVHCATGTGRTGTFILCDLGLHSTAAEGTVDLFAEASKMYTARANMLENLQQYILAHLLPTQCLLTLPTKLSCSDVTREEIGRMKKDLRIHMRRLGISVWKEKALRPSYEPLKPPNPDHLQKNRFPKFIPVEHSLVGLKRCPPDATDSDYISAVSVDGLKVKGQYLASQLPLPSTLSDFWRLVAEKRTELIVILQRPRPEGVECVDIIPRKTSTLRPVPHIVVKTKTLGHSDEHFTTDKLQLIDTSEEAPRTQNITVLTCNGWNLSEDGDPPQPKVLVKLYMASEKVQRVESPTLVLCYDGVTGCGLYLALSILLERMAVEQECDVISAVRAIRQSRRDFVYSKAQFEYLYDAALEFVQDFGNYSNMVSRPTMPGTATLNSNHVIS